MSAEILPAILFVLPSLTIGGSEMKTVGLANSLAERGADITLAYLNPPTPLLAKIGQQVRIVHLQRRGKLSITALRSLIMTIRNRHNCIVIAVNLYPAIYIALARLRLGRARFRFFIAVNTTDFTSRTTAMRMLLYRPIMRGADKIIFGAEIQRNLWRERYGIGVRGASTAVLYNGVDTKRFGAAVESADARKLGLRTRYVIGTIGRMHPEKAHVHLVRATDELRKRGFDVGALVIGAGSEQPVIEAEIARRHLQDYVALAGQTQDVRPYLALMDVFVLTSIGIETFSNAALEAMAAGIPVVSSSIGGMDELVAFGGGLTYPPGDIFRLTDLLAKLLQNEERRQQMGREARAAAIAHFSWEKMVDGFIALIHPQSFTA